jgi:hypothetical protein
LTAPGKGPRPGDRAVAGGAGGCDGDNVIHLTAPAVVLGGEPLDERGDLGADRRMPRPVRIGPPAGDQAAVPARDGAGSNESACSQPSGRSRISAARAARSAQSSPGRGSARRSTATPCRTTGNSASLEADDRPSRTSLPQPRTTVRQSRRRDTDDHDAARLARPSSQVTGHAYFWHRTGSWLRARQRRGGQLSPERKKASPCLDVRSPGRWSVDRDLAGGWTEASVSPPFWTVGRPICAGAVSSPSTVSSGQEHRQELARGGG